MELGQKVKINKVYKTTFKNVKRGKDFDFIKVWKLKKIKEKEGVFVGFRILKEGDFDWETHRVTKHIKVALIAINLRGCVYAPLNCL